MIPYAPFYPDNQFQMKTIPLTVPALLARLDAVMFHDKSQLTRRLHGVAKVKSAQARQTILTQLAHETDAACNKLQQRLLNRPLISYPQNLPVSQKKQAIADALREHQVIIVAGETGSGKTTQLPKICLELGRGIHGIIGHTQPRRLAASSVAIRIATELNTAPGGCVGYKVRFSDQVSDHTLIKLMTDGILLAEIQQDKLLRQYDTIIIDEAHERSLNIDFLLGYLTALLPRRPDLKLIITSATIDPQRFSRHFNHAPVIEVSGRTYPVEVRYRPIADQADNYDRDQLQAIFDAVEELSAEPPGDILIFMSGEREIRDTADGLQKLALRHTEILPLYSRLSGSEQQRIFQPHTGRRIVLATNVAETSLTVPGIKYVIDTGRARISRYSHRTKVQRLPIEIISRASASQRAGRCGRTSDGICIRLYSEQDFLSRAEFTEPEIMRTSLASVILQMSALQLGDISAFPFPDAPDKRQIQDGIHLLEELGALTPARGGEYRLTEPGRKLAQLPVDPRLACMVLQAAQQGCVHEVMIIAAALSIQDPRERPLDKQQAADEKHRRFQDKESDFISLIRLWDYLQEQQKTLSSAQFRRLCRTDYLNYLRVREWQDLYSQLRQSVKQQRLPINSQPASYQSLHCALLAGLLSHTGNKDVSKPEYIGARNTRFALYPASGLFKKPPKWVIVAELMETSRLWGRVAARIEAEWIEPLAQHLVKRSYSEPRWHNRQGMVIAREKVTLYGLVIVPARDISYSRIDPALCRELFIRHALVEGDWQTRHRFFHQNQKLRAHVEQLEHKSRRRDILVDDETLYEFYHQRLPEEILSSQHFDSWWKQTSRQTPGLLDFDQQLLVRDNTGAVNQSDYPNNWQQNNLSLRLSYQFSPGQHADGVTVHIPLPLLNQISEQGFDWQIPGLRCELVIALIKSLPKSLRRNFVPAPDYARAFLERVTPMQMALTDSLQQELQRMTGVRVDSSAWCWQQVADHLKISFRIEDEQRNALAESKDLAALKQQLKTKLQHSLSAVAQTGIEQTGLQQWSFGKLERQYQQQRAGYKIQAWPALVDDGDSVSVRLFDNQQEQQQQMLRGLRRLLLLNIPSPVKYLHEKLPNKSKLGLYFTPFGNVPELIDDCIACGVDKIIAPQGDLIWDEAAFTRLRDLVREHINPVVLEIARAVEQILCLAHQINKRLKGSVDISIALALADIKRQLAGLIYPGFVTANGYQRLGDSLRYLQAIDKRLEKMAQNASRDRVHMLKIEQIQQLYQQWLNRLTPAHRQQPQVTEIRWMIEELRVSYFAQQLGTPYPISEKRIQQAMAQFML